MPIKILMLHLLAEMKREETADTQQNQFQIGFC